MSVMTSDKGAPVTIAPGVWYKRVLAFLWHDVILILYLGVIALFVEVTSRYPSIKVEEFEKRSDHVAVITGGPRGLALGIIKRLAQLDYTIIMGVRNVEDSQRRLENFTRQNPDLKFKVKLFRMDLHSLCSVKEFAEAVIKDTHRIDLLLCNAAVMREPYKITEDGYESQFQANYLSNFLLTTLLLDRMKKTAKLKGYPCQVIYSSSIVYRCGDVNFEELEKSIVYTPYKFYFPSKMYGVMSMQTLEKKVEKDGAQVHFYCVHPGLIPTDLWYSAAGNLLGRFSMTARRCFRTIENGADTILLPAFLTEYQGRGGLYFEGGKPVHLTTYARNEEIQTKLYERSMELVEPFLN